TGVKFNFTDYTLDVAKELQDSDAALYVGRLHLVYSLLYTEDERRKSEADFYDGGTIWPPTCQYRQTMEQDHLELFCDRLDYYHFSLVGLAFAGLFGYAFLSSEHRRNQSLKLSLGILIVVGFYELLAVFVSSQKIVNLWVFNIFNSHVAAVLFFLLLRSFLKRESHKKTVHILIVLFLLISMVLHLTG